MTGAVLTNLQGLECFVNLTNGLEWLPILKEQGIKPHYVRISSMDIEHDQWNRLLVNLDANLLMRLALGERCVILDCGTGRDVGKVIYRAVPYIDMVLTDMWMREKEMEGRTKASCDVKRKLGYFKRFLNTKMIWLEGRSFCTAHDGDREFYQGLVEMEVGCGS